MEEKKVEKQLKEQAFVDELGFIVKTGVDKETLLRAAANAQPAGGTKSSTFPTATLMSNSTEPAVQQLVANINILVYLILLSAISDEVASSDRLDPLFRRLVG